MYSSTMANPDDEKASNTAESARVLVDAIKNQLLPRQIITRKSIENAVSLIMAVGGSTNAVLHYLAIAHSAGVEWTLEDFERVRRKVPVLADLKPSGRYVATDLHKAGGIPQVLKILLENGLLHGDCITITGKTMAEMLADVPAEPRSDQDVIRPFSNPMYAHGHLAVLKGNLAPEGCVAKITGLKNPVITGPARVFDSEEAALDAILTDRIKAGRRDGDSLRGPEGRTGHARNAGANLGADRQRLGRERRTDYRRQIFRRHLGHGRRPRGALKRMSEATLRWSKKTTRSRSTRTSCCCS